MSSLTNPVYPSLMALVAGVDSSTQSVKVLIRDAISGQLIREGRARHPDGSEVDPAYWLNALNEAVKNAGGLSDVEVLSIAGQQHGLVALADNGAVLRPALLWNDTRSAQSATDLNSEIGGEQEMADRTGSVLVASFTASKLRWMADHEPELAAQISAVALPHDWLSWKLQGSNDLSDLFTDRSDASGTGYFDPVTNTYDTGLFARALRSDRMVHLPSIVSSNDYGGETRTGIKLGAGAGDNAAAAFGLQTEPGDVVLSLGTSGTAFAVSKTATHDGSGAVAGFADLTGNYLPLACTLNAARVLDAGCTMLGVDFDRLAALALSAPPGANGLTLLPYFEGERTPNRPSATGILTGMNLSNSHPSQIARAMFEGMIAGLVCAVDELLRQGVEVNRILLIGGAAKNPAVAEIASALFGREILIPVADEYVANGAARQASWALMGEPAVWKLGKVNHFQSKPTPQVMDAYRQLRDRTVSWS
jgi:xylulokinase